MGLTLAVALAIALAAIVFSAGLGKLRDRARAARAIDAFAVLPPGLGARLAAPLGMLECALGLALLPAGTRSGAALCVLLLLLAYWIAVARSIARGETDFDCGCGGFSGALRPGPALLARNGVLVVCAAVIACSEGAAPVAGGWLAAGALALALLGAYALANHLLARAQWPADD